MQCVQMESRESPELLFQCGGVISAFESHFLVAGMVSYSVLKATSVNEDHGLDT